MVLSYCVPLLKLSDIDNRCQSYLTSSSVNILPSFGRVIFIDDIQLYLIAIKLVMRLIYEMRIEMDFWLRDIDPSPLKKKAQCPL